MKELKLIARARSHGDAPALSSGSVNYTYADLLDRSATLAAGILGEAEDLQEARVAFLAPAGIEYLSVQWGIWRAGGITLPLCLTATQPELEYAIGNAGADLVLTTSEHAHKVKSLCEEQGLTLMIVDELASFPEKTLPEIEPQRRAMVLYTSGTTSKPKGVVTTHANIQAQIESLVEAWQWEKGDRIPLFLPLYHIHGVINIASCALWAGAKIEAFSHLEMETILQRVAAGAYTVFMAVPTIYVKLIDALESMTEQDRASTIQGFADMRLMISGSAALPASVHEKWTALTGQKLLERYGMTEIGMALSNPYHGERRPGSVGLPLPKVEIRLKSEEGDLVIEEGEPGEIQVRGPGVFHEYWNLPEVTAESFDGSWFRTGDMAVIETGYYRIMGRLSVDIIKSGGYKLSALEIEAALLLHPAIRECAVIGVPDDIWGEMVAVAAVLEQSEQLDLESLRVWCRDRLSTYKIPKRLLLADSLPRNAMGKITKPAVKDLF